MLSGKQPRDLCPVLRHPSALPYKILPSIVLPTVLNLHYVTAGDEAAEAASKGKLF